MDNDLSGTGQLQHVLLASTGGAFIAAVVVVMGYRMYLAHNRMQAEAEAGESAPESRMRYLRRLFTGICMASPINSRRGSSHSRNNGLDDHTIKSLPTFTFRRGDTYSETSSYYCMVCLEEFTDGETGRILPQCGHFFHVECIDMWFFSHRTCPLCRVEVESPPEESSKTIPATFPPGICSTTPKTEPHHSLIISDGVCHGLCPPECHTSGSQHHVDLELGMNVDLGVGEHVGREEPGEHGCSSQSGQRLASKYSRMEDLD